MAILRGFSRCVNGLQVLEESLGLTGSYDGVLVAIDCEHTGNLRNGFRDSQDSQVGLAILDPHDLLVGETETPKIATHNFVTGSVPYTTKSSERFLFGKAVTVSTGDLLRQIEAVLPQDRDIILIGHSVGCEVAILRTLGFKFQAVCAIVETTKLANEVFEFWRGSLGSLLRICKCPFSDLHNGGNDAHFTLRAALHLVDKGCQQIECESLAALEAIRGVLSIPIPIRPDVKIMLAKKKEKAARGQRRLNSRKKKSRTAEEQDQIRAERAARRKEAESRPQWCFV